ncbi:DNA mismatch repair protein MutL, partial [Enterobacter kobei]|nr:DNA mismatch repair protein MutL [Enterobacter kobei]
VLSVLRQVTEDTLSLDEEDNGALTATTFPENRQVAGENVFSQPYQAPVTSSTQKKSTGAYQGSAGKGLTDTQKSPQKTLDTR